MTELKNVVALFIFHFNKFAVSCRKLSCAGFSGVWHQRQNRSSEHSVGDREIPWQAIINIKVVPLELRKHFFFFPPLGVFFFCGRTLTGTKSRMSTRRPPQGLRRFTVRRSTKGQSVFDCNRWYEWILLVGMALPHLAPLLAGGKSELAVNSWFFYNKYSLWQQREVYLHTLRRSNMKTAANLSSRLLRAQVTANLGSAYKRHMIKFR